LLNEFGSIEELLKNTDKLKGKQRQNVETYGSQGLLSKELATIIQDVPIEFNPDDYEYTGPDPDKLKALFAELEFRTLTQRVFKENLQKPKVAVSEQLGLFSGQEEEPELEVVDETPPIAVADQLDTIINSIHDYYCIEGDEAIRELVAFLEIQDEFCFDTEASSVNPNEAELVGMSFSYVEGEAFYVPVPSDPVAAQSVVEHFRGVFENANINKIGHNIKYDILVLKNYGIEVRGKLFCTMLAHYLIAPEGRHSMDWLAQQYLNYDPVPIESLIGKKGKSQANMRDMLIQDVVEYASEDADITLRLKKKLEPELQRDHLGQLFFKVETPLVPVLAAMEYEGIRIDTESLKEMALDLENTAREIEQRVYELAGEQFNLASPKQLGEILFNKLNLLPNAKKTKTGQFATGEEVLSKLAMEHEIAQAILDHRQVVKLKSTYVDALPSLIN